MLLLSLPPWQIGIASQSYSDCGDENRLGITEFALATTAGNSGDSQDSPLLDHRCINANGYCGGVGYPFGPEGHAGPDPPVNRSIGAPVPPSALPGLIVALILGLAGGVSLGPEHPIMTVNIALAVAIGARLLPRVNRMEWTILASAEPSARCLVHLLRRR